MQIRSSLSLFLSLSTVYKCIKLSRFVNNKFNWNFQWQDNIFDIYAEFHMTEKKNNDNQNEQIP